MREQSNDQKNRATTAAASTVGAISGNVTLVANDVYRQVGSDVIAPKGDITIAAKTVEIVEARETSRTETEQKFKQTGITLEVSSPILSALQTAQSLGQAVGNTSDGRMQALGLAAAGLNGYNTYKSLTDAAGNLSPEKAASISINLSLGTSQNQSNSLSQSDTARGSTATAGGNLTIAATGAGKDSNLLVQGSTLGAANNVSLAADNEIRLLAARNEASQTTSNSSSSGSLGVSFGIGAGGVGPGFSASASKGQGSGNGQDTSYTNTQVNAGNTATLTSGGDTSLIGAVVAANTVKATAGGNLNIQSLQDTSTYTSQQSSAGASISFGGGKVTGGGISASKSNIDSNYQSVNQTSGIQAGDGGFQVAVNKTTDLKGGVIASTEAAVALSRNTFTTGALSFSDIRNSAEYKGSGYSVSASMGTGQDADRKTIYLPGGGFGVGSAEGNASSTTTAGISGIAGNTAVRTGDAATGIQKIFDAATVQKEIDAQMAITAAFGQQASSAWGSFANQQLVDAKDDETRACWGANGACRLAGHTVIGALGGGVEGALGAAAGTGLTPYLSKAIDDLGISGPMHDILVAGLSSTVGGLVGGTSGAAGAFNEVTNNYLTSKQWQELPDKLGACAKKTSGCSTADEAKIRQEFQAISKKQDAELKVACADLSSANCRNLMAIATLGTVKQLELGQQYATTKVGLPDYYLSGSDFNTTIPLLQSKIDAYDIVAACAANQAQCQTQRLNGSIRLALTGVSVAAMTAFSVELGVVGMAVLGDSSGTYCALRPQQCLNLLNGVAEMATGVPISGYNPLTVSARTGAGYGKTTYTGPDGTVIKVGDVVPSTAGALGGSSGPKPSWPVQDVQPLPSFVQSGETTCGQTCAAYMVQGMGFKNVNENTFIKALGTDITSEKQLADAIQAVTGMPMAGGATTFGPANLSAVEMRGVINNLTAGGSQPLMTLLQTPGSSMTSVGHWVMIQGVNSAGNVIVRDPAGLLYTMTPAAFGNAWKAGVLVKPN